MLQLDRLPQIRFSVFVTTFSRVHQSAKECARNRRDRPLANVLDRENALLRCARIGESSLNQPNASQRDEISGHPSVGKRSEIAQLTKDEIEHLVRGVV